MADESSKKGSLTKMHFEAFTDATFMHRISEKPTEFQVDVNPDSFTRNIALKEMKTKERGQTNSNGQDAGMEAETYTFKLIFDGTGVIDGVKRDLNKELNDFLHVVYCYSNKEKKTNCVIMTYCGEQFLCKIRSLNVQYTLFNRDSSPLPNQPVLKFQKPSLSECLYLLMFGNTRPTHSRAIEQCPDEKPHTFPKSTQSTH